MKRYLRIAIILFFSRSIALQAQTAFEITALEGTAKIQRVQKPKWEKLSVGDKIADNDIIETFFQSKLTLKFGEGAITVFGSNSKALINISSKNVTGATTQESSVSLFNGGVFAKVTGKTHLSIFSTNAVGEIDSGSIAMIVDGKTGETGVLVLGGKAMVRNISQQKGKELTVGLTTLLLPGKEPSPPLYLSFRHAAVLKNFFGDQYISAQLQASSIVPTDDRNTGSRVSLSQGLESEKKKSGSTFYKRLFNVNKIYGSILDDRHGSTSIYTPIVRPSNTFRRHASIGISGGAGAYSNSFYPAYSILPRFRFPYFDAALRFSIAANDSLKMVTGLNSTDGIIDIIQSISVGSIEDSMFCMAGTLSDITLGHGLIVDHFRNSDNNRIYHPMGVLGKAALNNAMLTLFLASVKDPSLGGIYLSMQPSYYSIGAGFYFDRNQYAKSSRADDFRYTRSEPGGSVFPDTSAVKASAAIYEIDFGAMIAQSYYFSLQMNAEFAQKIFESSNDGFILRLPSIRFKWPMYAAGCGIKMESGRLLSQEFNEFYCSRRSWLKHDSLRSPTADTIIAYTTALWKRRSSGGLFLSFGANPARGTDFSITYSQDLRTRNTYVVWNPDSTTDTLNDYRNDFSFDVRFSINNDCVPLIRHGTVYLRQIHGTMFPSTGALLSSWNTEAGFGVLTTPLFFDISLETGGRLFYLDRGPHPDDAISADDRVFEIFASIRWDFL